MQLTLEKTVPLGVSLLLHVALLVALLFMYLPKPEEEPEPLPIMLHIMQPPELPAAPAEAEAETAPPTEVKATTVEPAEEPTPETPAVAEVVPEESPAEPEPSSPPPPEISNPKTASYADSNMLDQMRRELEQSKAEQRKREMELLTEITEMEAVKAPGEKSTFTSSGGDRGTVRELNIERYPEHMQRIFMARYGVQIRTKYVAGGGGTSYINRAKTGKGTYYNRGGSGYFEVMTLTPAVISKMVSLEMEEMEKRGMEPLRTEITNVEFGLKQDDRGLVDLCVTRFQARVIE